jgi:hypothetical protein
MPIEDEQLVTLPDDVMVPVPFLINSPAKVFPDTIYTAPLFRS